MRERVCKYALRLWHADGECRHEVMLEVGDALTVKAVMEVSRTEEKWRYGGAPKPMWQVKAEVQHVENNLGAQ